MSRVNTWMGDTFAGG